MSNWMFGADNSIVIGGDGLQSAEVLETHLEPPKSRPNWTSKEQYAIKLKKRVCMASVHAEDNNKLNGIFKSVGCSNFSA